jgi:hypothetical protein
MTSRRSGKEEYTQAEAADRLGITPQALGVWARKPGAPVVTRKGRPFCVWPDFPRWREAELEKSRTRIQPDQALAESERMEAQAKAEIARMKAEQMRGELVPLALHQRRLDAFIGGFVAVVTGRLTRFERDMVAASTPAEARKITEAMKTQLLQGGQDYASALESYQEDE